MSSTDKIKKSVILINTTHASTFLNGIHSAMLRSRQWLNLNFKNLTILTVLLLNSAWNKTSKVALKRLKQLARQVHT